MQQDEFFPLDAIPPRVRRAILQEFPGTPTHRSGSRANLRSPLVGNAEVGPSTWRRSMRSFNHSYTRVMVPYPK